MTKIILSCIIIMSCVYFSNLYSQNTQKGMASYYAHKFHKRKAASGQIYHKDSMVCAHRSYPFGTILEVWNPKNDKFVLVKVIDRGPFVKKRIIDLSYAAAKMLDIISEGVAFVEVFPYIPLRYEPFSLFDLTKKEFLPNIAPKPYNTKNINQLYIKQNKQ